MDSVKQRTQNLMFKDLSMMAPRIVGSEARRGCEAKYDSLGVHNGTHNVIIIVSLCLNQIITWIESIASRTFPGKRLQNP